MTADRKHSVAQTIVCAVDGSRRASRVLHVAADLARALQARLVVLHVFDPMMVPVPPTRELHYMLSTEQIVEHHRQDAHAALARAADGVGDVEHEALLVEGTPAAEILGVVQERQAALVITGTAARSPLERILQGSVAARVVAEGPCPAVVVSDAAALGGDGPVLAAYDGSAHSLRAARHAAALAAGLGRQLMLVQIAESGDPGVRADAALAAELHAAARSCVSGAPTRPPRLDVTVVVERGEPVEHLLRIAQQHDAAALVVGSRGRGAITAAVFGSVSARLVQSADRPVVVAGPRSDMASGMGA